MKISNYRTINKNSLIGAFDLELSSGLCIYGAMYMKKGDSDWCSFPAIPIVDKEGAKSWKAILNIPDRDIRDKFNAQVLSALRTAGHIS